MLNLDEYVGKYVRYVAEGSDFMNKGDYGRVVSTNEYGKGLEITWLNPKVKHRNGLTTWFVLLDNIEVVE